MAPIDTVEVRGRVQWVRPSKDLQTHLRILNRISSYFRGIGLKPLACLRCSILYEYSDCTRASRR